MITESELKSILTYDNGVFRWKETLSSKQIKGNIAGHTNARGYTSIKIKGKNYYSHRLVWLYFNGETPSKEIDHIDMDKTNNKIENLRECDKFQNQCNTLSRVGSMLKSKGVDFMKSKGMYRSRITVRGVAIHLGLFYTEHAASLSYQIATCLYQEGYGTTRSSSDKNKLLK